MKYFLLKRDKKWFNYITVEELAVYTKQISQNYSKNLIKAF